MLEIIQGKTTVAQTSCQFDLTPTEIESRVEDAKRSMENVLRAKPEDIRERKRVEAAASLMRQLKLPTMPGSGRGQRIDSAL